jgi:hypothetical protein
MAKNATGTHVYTHVPNVFVNSVIRNGMDVVHAHSLHGFEPYVTKLVNQKF